MKSSTLNTIILIGALAVSGYFLYSWFKSKIPSIPDVNKPPEEKPLPYIIGPIGWLLPDIKLPEVTLPSLPSLPPNITLTAPPAVPPVSVIPKVIDIALKAPGLLLGGGTKKEPITYGGKVQPKVNLPVSPKNITPDIALGTFSRSIRIQDSTERAREIFNSLGMIREAVKNVKDLPGYHNR